MNRIGWLWIYIYSLPASVTPRISYANSTFSRMLCDFPGNIVKVLKFRLPKARPFATFRTGGVKQTSFKSPSIDHKLHHNHEAFVSGENQIQWTERLFLGLVCFYRWTADAFPMMAKRNASIKTEKVLPIIITWGRGKLHHWRPARNWFPRPASFSLLPHITQPTEAISE